ncbi:hypothetical protein [Pseudomonas sp. CGJS7]|uniref:hypothetical protein n=1 Tax=Pseudomonas sp. CGJS7 TaxID=3109348 RepID=UPI00300B4382
MKGLRTRARLFGLGLVIALASIGSAHADSWDLPRVQTYESADKNWRFVATPRRLESQLAYFDEAMAREKAGAGPRPADQRAQGKLEHRVQGQWRPVWAGPLLNDVGPVSALVSQTGRVVTFDNWHSTGYGNNVVVIYDDKGATVRSMALKDFLPEDYLYALPNSVSSVQWYGDHAISADGQRLIVRVVAPGTDPELDEPRYIEVNFDLATGRRLPGDQRAWNRALRQAAQIAKKVRAEEAAREAGSSRP